MASFRKSGSHRSIDVASIVYLVNVDDVLGNVDAVDNADTAEAIAELAF